MNPDITKAILEQIPNIVSAIFNSDLCRFIIFLIFAYFLITQFRIKKTETKLQSLMSEERRIEQRLDHKKEWLSEHDQQINQLTETVNHLKRMLAKKEDL